VLSTNKTAKVPPKSGRKVATAPVGRPKPVALTPKEEEKLVDDLARLAISLHREALKELERY